MDVLRRTALYICAFHVISCRSLAEFDMFPGFGHQEIKAKRIESEKVLISSEENAQSSSNENVTPLMTSPISTTSTSSSTLPPAIETNSPSELTTLQTNNTTSTNQISNDHATVDKQETASVNATTTKTSNKPTKGPIIYKPYVCPEEEIPLNIGPYEVPTQRDLVIHVKKTLKARFNDYHNKALFFLNDIQEATKATAVVEAKCMSKSIYKQCVKHVSAQCQSITKSLVTSLERQRHDVSAFTKATICNYTSMVTDPIHLIKIIAMEEASLEFSLSGFLRLLGACEHYCKKDYNTVYQQKPARHMSDQDLVIKHFLTRKNYVQLLNDNTPSIFKVKNKLAEPNKKNNERIVTNLTGGF